MSIPKRNAQDKDITFPNPPSDGISTISVNGTISTASNMVIAGSWDNNVRLSTIVMIRMIANHDMIPETSLSHRFTVMSSNMEEAECQV